MYHCPRPYGHQWKPRGRGYGRHIEHQRRPNPHFNTTVSSSTYTNNEEHWCETCDRGFSTREELDRHKQQHQKCNIDGCQFVAHPKVITKHIQMQHSSGLYKKISKLDNPEEIQKWREERKKKYPTRMNIDMKAAEIREKVERGEKMALTQKNRNGSYTSAPHSGQGRGRKRKHGFGKNKQNHIGNDRSSVNQKLSHITNDKGAKPAKIIPKNVLNISSVTVKNILKPFAGILSIVMSDNEMDDVNNTLDKSNPLIEDDYYENPMSYEEKILQEPSRCGALTLLMCDYESSEDETNKKENTTDDGTIKQINNASYSNMKHLENVTKRNVEKSNSYDKPKENIPNANKNNYNGNVENSDEDSGPEEIKCLNNVVEIGVPQETNIKIKEPVIPVKRLVQSKNTQRQKYRHTVPSTLLQKLLHQEIRHERNIVLQCIRYIKRMNYFDKIVQ